MGISTILKQRRDVRYASGKDFDDLGATTLVKVNIRAIVARKVAIGAIFRPIGAGRGVGGTSMVKSGVQSMIFPG